MQGLRPAALRIYEKKMQMENVKMGKSTQTATHTLVAIGYLLNAAEITIDCTAGWGGEIPVNFIKIMEKKERKKRKWGKLKKTESKRQIKRNPDGAIDGVACRWQHKGHTKGMPHGVPWHMAGMEDV